jgi:hypothetical protein
LIPFSSLLLVDASELDELFFALTSPPSLCFLFGGWSAVLGDSLAADFGDVDLETEFDCNGGASNISASELEDESSSEPSEEVADSSASNEAGR